MLSIYTFKDPINYINSFINHRKQDNSRFDAKTLSSDLGLSSPIQVIDILKGKKKVKDKFFDAFSDYAKLNKSERMYFQAIVSKSKESNPERLRMFDLLIEELRPSQNESISINYQEELDIFTDWIYTAILSLSELRDFDLTVDNIKNKLLSQIDSNRIENSLFKLFQYGLLRLNDEGRVEKKYLRTTTTRGTLKLKDLESYYLMICELAKESLNLDPSEVEFNMFSFPIDEENIPLAKEIICKCRNQLSRLSEEGKPSKVYQANLSLFPLTK